MNRPFVSETFDLPKVLETADFRLRMLTVNDVVKDYDAVMTSADHLQGLFGAKSKWPSGLTLEQNLIDLGWHQKEFQKRSSFAYTVISLDEITCLGCVYIYPPATEAFEAEVRLWVRASEAENGLEQKLFQAVRQWLEDVWPFTVVAYPGRDEVTGRRNDK
jgi:hypothetical protein